MKRRDEQKAMRLEGEDEETRSVLHQKLVEIFLNTGICVKGAIKGNHSLTKAFYRILEN